MDAKSKANFINSVAGAQKIPCPKCNSLNEADSKFCATCGTKLGNNQEGSAVPAQDSQGKNIVVTSGESSILAQVVETPASSAPAFAAARPREEKSDSESQGRELNPQTDTSKPAFQMAMPELEEIPEEKSVFAEGLPSWDIVPPQVVVRRKNK